MDEGENQLTGMALKINEGLWIAADATIVTLEKSEDGLPRGPKKNLQK